MSSPRIRRLTLDAERIDSRFSGWPKIQITNRSGFPPEQYRVTYRIKGLYAAPNGSILERDEHIMEINLSLGYPRRAPQCRMLTPIFHPNFDEASVCIGDFWAASEGLDDLIVRIGRMIAYQEYNTKSPLNGLAARWTDQHAHLLPVEASEIAPPSVSAATSEDEKVIVRLNESGDALNGSDNDTVSPTHHEVRTEQVLLVPRLNFGSFGVRLDLETTTLGRSEDNAIQLFHASVSSHHAEIVCAPSGEFLVRDLGSTNGVTVNDIPVQQSPLVSGDRVCFGDIEAAFHE